MQIANGCADCNSCTESSDNEGCSGCVDSCGAVLQIGLVVLVV